MKNLPLEIYLNFGVDKDEADLTNVDFDDLTDIAWADSKINDQDVKYVLPSPDVVSKRIFAIKDTSGELVRLYLKQETAEKELERYKEQHPYTDFYIDEEIVYG